MRLLLCLAASLAVCWTHPVSRVTRGVVAPSFPHFHAVHHGYGATSYQNVQIENHGSVPIPTENHHVHHQHHVELHVHPEEPHYPHHPHEIHEAVAVIPSLEGHHYDHLQDHLQDHHYIIVQKEVHEVPVHEVEAIPVVENHDEHHQIIALEHENDLQHIQLHEVPHYYATGYGHPEHDYEYH